MKINELFVDLDNIEPLSKEDLIKLTKQMREGHFDLEARNKVITHNIGAVVKRVLKKFNNPIYDKKELISVGMLGLIYAVDTFDFKQGSKFSIYATECIDDRINTFLTSENKYSNVDSLDNPLFYVSKTDVTLKDVIIDESMDLVYDYEEYETILEVREQLEQLSDRDKDIVKLYFGFCGERRYTKKEISELSGLSQRCISKIIRTSVKSIRQNMLRPKKDNLSPREKDLVSSKTVSANLDVTTIKSGLQTDDFVVKEKDPTSVLLMKLYSNHFYINDISRNDYIKMLEWIKSPLLSSIIDTFSVEEVMILSMRFGYSEGKIFTTREIINFLKVEEAKIRSAEKKALQCYKELINQKLTKLITDAITSSQTNSYCNCLNIEYVTKEDYIILLEWIKSPLFSSMIGTFSPQESMVLSMKYGYIDQRFFTTSAIADFLNINELEVRNIEKMALNTYKRHINQVIDRISEIGDDCPTFLK